MHLAAFLQLAYSAEMAAALAYRGHARAVADAHEQMDIQRIEAEEWAHRAHLRRMMNTLHIKPSRWLEWKYACIGHTIGLACHVLGYFMPMYFAGRLESENVNEYLRLVDLVHQTPIAHEIPCLRVMAENEKEHEQFFLARVVHHRWEPIFRACFRWGAAHSFNELSAAPGDLPLTTAIRPAAGSAPVEAPNAAVGVYRQETPMAKH
jgi:demethoxyubiquinone hydroxylase (CLK1/Coq7/Cat5 family)